MKFLSLIPLLCLALGLPGARGSELRVVKAPDDSFSFQKDGAPFVFRGAGGQVELALLKACGANSLRTWGTEQTDIVIDEAARLGLAVCAGLWIDHERHGVDYSDPARFAEELEKHCRAVDRLKDKPALALWGVGNEVETKSSNPRVWDVIEAIAAYIRKVDPKHPVMVTTAHATPAAVANILKHCPSVQILGCNSYAGLRVLANDVRTSGWTGPYLVTEWGNDGNWEVRKTTWGAEVEPSSHEKALQFRQRYALIERDRQRCLGSFAFYWGQKQEATATWFNLFTEGGLPTEPIQVLSEQWGGKPLLPAAPQVGALLLNGSEALPGLELEPGAEVRARTVIDGAPTAAGFWYLYQESRDKGLGGDLERKPEAVSLAVLEEGRGNLRFKAPLEPGAYRLFFYAVAGGKSAGTANFPFLVKGIRVAP